MAPIPVSVKERHQWKPKKRDPTAEGEVCKSQRTAPAVVFRPNSAFQAPRCPAGHELRITVCLVGAQDCDSCKRNIESTYTHRCRACDYDLCRRCFIAMDEENFDDAHDGFASLQLEQSHAEGDMLVLEPPQTRLDSAAEATDPNTTGVPVNAWSEQKLVAPDNRAIPSRLFPRNSPVTERRNQRIRHLYGVGTNRSYSSGCSNKLPPTKLRTPSQRIQDLATSSNAAPNLRLPVNGSAAVKFSGDVQAAVSAFAAMGLPSAEKWRAECASTVAEGMGNSEDTTSHRCTAMRAMVGRQRRSGVNEPGILRPCVDDLQGCFGRTRWEFE